MNMKIVTIKVKNLSSSPKQENEQLKSNIKKELNLKKIWFKSFKKQKKKIRG